ncbi:xylulokinase [Avibacterium sp. 21-599]|uniref:xylulokinase n=1 Tax=Avibacterium sp. 21-599 TaxID=2911528 RepID=UPI0022483669|nr:FGGY-family carbohydrate kinase [Avibacterium sp. 21-599]MCW9718914.1 FGGY-family carbohydrate kinase [Avibacterium sp. 21-599]
MLSEKNIIENGEAILGIEFGSTRIKAVLINSTGKILATGIFDWENHLDKGIWTYYDNEILKGLQTAYLNLSENVREKYQVNIKKLSAIGISAMMHGYLPFDRKDKQLTEFRTWRNNITQQASKELTTLFQYNIPQRWSIAHLYQAILNNEPHLNELNHITTLSGYIHWKLTNEKVLGIGDASGMFPIDIKTKSYDSDMIEAFNQLIRDKNYPWKLEQLLPKVLVAGEIAGKLTQDGARLLDPSGNLCANIPFCPPEGDAGTGMIATNSIKEKTGNISAGTSAFAMIVLEHELSNVYEELDMVMTPAGKLVAMAHSNNCTSDINAWISLFSECLYHFGVNIYSEELYEALFLLALKGESNCGKLLSYGFYSGEHNIGLSEGCPIFIHPTNANFNLANFMRAHIYSAFAAMKIGVDILQKKENVHIDQIFGHGGVFKTTGVAQKILASALNTPIATMKTAGEGGAWGIALLANYINKCNTSLEDYLDKIFAYANISVTHPDKEIIQGYNAYMKQYLKNLPIVKKAIELNHLGYN